MKISVLMTVYIREIAQYLTESIESILNQTVKASEIVIVKDGPVRDEINETLKYYEEKYPGFFKIITLEKNQGSGIASKIGIENCSYELIARMDSDDISMPNRFEKQLKYLKEHLECRLIGSNHIEFTDKGREVYKHFPSNHKELVKFSKSRNPFSTPSVIMYKEDVLSVGNYRNKMLFEDYDMWVRLIVFGVTIHNIPEILVKVRTTNGLYGRRGGFKYIKYTWLFYKGIVEIGFLNWFEVFPKFIYRSLIATIPAFIREWFYIKFLRKKFKK